MAFTSTLRRVAPPLRRPRKSLPLQLLTVLLLTLAVPALGAPVGTAFTYQGRLMDEGLPASGQYDLQLSLYDASAGGAQIGSTANLAGVNVADGRFTVRLDFGTLAFGSGARWLEISVRPSGGGGYTLLAPRQELTPTPYALGMPNVYTDEANGFVGIGRSGQITGNEKFGVRAQAGPGTYGGMYVETSDPDGWPFIGFATGGTYRAWTYYTTVDADAYHIAGWHLYADGLRLTVPSTGGLRVGNSSTDGIEVIQTGDDGVQVGHTSFGFPHYGLYIPPNPGVSYYGLWPNTANASGEWALYTVDNISAGNVFASAQTLIASVTGPDVLERGDLVVADGLTPPVPGGTERLVQVRRASGGADGLVGVVTGRMVFDLAPGKEDEGARSLQSADGPARAGDYVALVVLGVAEVRVAPGASIAKGARLTADATGAARPLRTESLNGMVVAEGAPTIGTALASASGGTVPVFISLR
ncbi:MAG: DUF2190 family protein [Candidatus Krumholzibacteriia bacterium]|nr:DUF2190 family protein [Candidatus Latescibacterota bacterium]